ncbi:hypothetical protein pipiens_009137 [Culex pipiens pipiens]|uniref:Long form D7 salivary protein n=1 Tax=Culex pipiens pipiens TaxID=38569 RepID=A0ABD1DEX2_CULPP
MSRLIKLLLLAQVSVSTCLAAWAPLNPEETLYVYTSCFDEWAPKDGTQRKAVAETWFKAWDLKPDNPGTHCFAKCVLEGVGLYDGKTNTMAVSRVVEQQKAFEKFNSYGPKEVNDLTSALSPIKPSSDCGQLYKVYTPVFEKFKKTIRSLYHGHKEVTEKIYKSLGSNIKQKDETYATFCAKKHLAKATKLRHCNIRQFSMNVKPDDDLKKYIDCLFKGYRYISTDGNFYAPKLLHDFHKIGNTKSDAKVETVLKGCKDTSAIGYHYCLLASNVEDEYGKALQYREIRSGNYKSVIEGDKYDEKKVEKQFKDILAKVCPNKEEMQKIMKNLEGKKDDYLTLGGGEILKS